MISNTAAVLRAATLCAAVSVASAASAGVDELPQDIQDKLYNPDLLDPNQPIGDSAYRDFVAKNPPPWTIGYASSYAGNTWRAAVMDRLQNEIIPKWKDLGMIDEVIITQSNLNDATQIQQIRQLVDQGVDAIVVCCSNPTALNASVEYAYNNDVAVFSGIGYLTSPYSVNSSANFVVGGRMMGEWMAEEIGGEGRVLNVEGIPGASASDSQNVGIEAAMAEYPDIEVKGPIAGMWTDQVAQAEVQRWLATNPGKLDGILIQSASELGALRALQQSGRPMVPITIGSEMGALCYWRNNPDYVSAAIHAWPPGDDFEMIWNIMMRTLQGQGPKIQSILTTPVKMTKEEMMEAIPEDCSEQSAGWYHPGIEEWAGKDFLDNFFLRPADPEAYDPASHSAAQ
ncbi:ABC transporter substrate-binding protein [Roseovarius indicus]|jgi:ribose transport system substrate-binding protein|uniref:ABC transporter substrate-binding protein n=1 Tax=Roseovarius indicus TaxID=540747 RepID=UPI0007DA0FEE|nr:ABC transporter substrate-binding protein [Roseovarius indicus]OAO07447.1 sugar ABC transporter substrate-binding protein [Roseovarius indicus]